MRVGEVGPAIPGIVGRRRDPGCLLLSCIFPSPLPFGERPATRSVGGGRGIARGAPWIFNPPRPAIFIVAAAADLSLLGRGDIARLQGKPGLRAHAGAALADRGIEQFRQCGIERWYIRPRRLGTGRLCRIFLRMLRRIALLGAFRHGPNMGRVCRRGKTLVIVDRRETRQSGSHIRWSVAVASGVGYSNLMPARLMTSPHFFESDAITAANSSGVPPAGSSPIVAKRALNAAD